jgi:ABC-type multidrug transport system ATPase subunit
VSVTVDRTPVLRGLTLTVGAEEAVGLVGANGSGKSTLLRLMATLLLPAAGKGQVLGARLGTREVERVRPGIALVGHTPALYPRLTLGENLAFYCRLMGTAIDAAEAALRTVGLSRAADRPADRCSHGMLRRAELARVLVAGPRLLLLDEAHAGLDRASAGLVDVVVDEVRGRGGGAVVVSHERSRLEATVDRILEIEDGALRPAHQPVRVVGEVLR